MANLRTIQSAIVSILSDNNTSTATNDLSANLQSRVKQIIAATPTRPIGNDEYPAILVYPLDKQEEMTSVGRNVLRDITINWRIAAVTYLADSSTAAHTECLILSDNIETILRNYIDLSQTVQESNIERTEWSFADTKSSYCHTADIDFRTKLYGSS